MSNLAGAVSERQRPSFWRSPILLWALPLIFLAGFFFYPLAGVFRLAIRTAVEEGLAADLWLRVLSPLAFTLWQALLSMLLTLLVGMPAAYLFARFTFPGKDVLRTLTTLPFIMPTVVVAASFNALLGPRGWANVLLVDLFNLSSPPIQILNSLPAILIAHVFYNTTVVLRVVGGAWAQLDTRLEHASRVLGASRLRTLWEVTIPLLRPAILSAALLVFLFDFTSFGVILLLGGPRYATLEVEIYLQALQLLNLPLAGLLSAVQIAFTLVLTVLYARITGAGAPVSLMPRVYGEAMRAPRGWKEKAWVLISVLVLVVLFASPLLALSARSVTQLSGDRAVRGELETGFTLNYYRELFINRRQSLFYVPPSEAIRNSLSYAGLTVLFSVSLGFLASYALNHRTALNRLLEPAIMLPLGTSAVTLGLGFIVVFNRPPLDVRSFPLLIPIAHSLVAFPFVVRTLQPALASIPQRLREAAATLGASPWRVWLEVDLPILARAAVVSAIFAFTISLGEFGATSFLSRPEVPTMPVAIFRFLSLPGAVNYGQALAMSTLLMLVCAVSILFLERVQEFGLGD